MKWVRRPLGRPPQKAEEHDDHHQQRRGIWDRDAERIGELDRAMVPAASRGPSSSARRRCHQPGLSILECWSVIRKPEGACRAQRTRPERYQIPACEDAVDGPHGANDSGPMTFRISATPDGAALLAIEGELDSTSSRDMREELEALVKRRPPPSLSTSPAPAHHRQRRRRDAGVPLQERARTGGRAHDHRAAGPTARDLPAAQAPPGADRRVIACRRTAPSARDYDATVGRGRRIFTSACGDGGRGSGASSGSSTSVEAPVVERRARRGRPGHEALARPLRASVRAR